MSHLNANTLSFTGMSQVSPGYQPNYVMGPAVGVSQRKREWTIPEIRTLMALGYQINPTFWNAATLNPYDPLDLNSTILVNTPAYRTNPGTPMLSYNTPYNFMELMQSDHTMTNANIPNQTPTSSWTTTVAAISNVADNELNLIRIMPNSLFGIRGVSDGGNGTGANNHLCVAVSALGDAFTYTPIPGFHGRAQFGFYLWDGHERGALRIVTIDITPTSNYTVTPGNQLVVYPDMEDGTELRQRTLNPNFENTQFADGQYESVFAGQNFSGGHNFNYWTNWWNIAGGDVTENPWYGCFMGTIPQNGYYGSPSSDWNLQNYGGFLYPIPTTTGTNQRYHHFQDAYNYSTLINPVSSCNVYHFECDLNFEKTGFAVGQTFQFQLQFTNNPFPGFHSQLYYTAPVQVTISTVTPDTWQHVVFDFQYCGDPTYYMNLLVEGIVTPTIVVSGTGSVGTPLGNTFSPAVYTVTHCTFIDNISLKQIDPTPPPVTLNATANPTTVCNGSSSILTALPTPYLPCNATYTWNPGNLNGYNVTSGPITATTTFTATVNYACTQTASGTVTVTPSAIPTITPAGPFCSNDAVGHQLVATPTASGSFWTGTGVNSSGVFTPSTAGSGTFVITYNYVPFAGCTTLVTTNIVVTASFTIVFGANGPYCSSQGPQNLFAQPTGGTWSGPGITANQFNPSAVGTGTFTLTYTVTQGGCTLSANTNVVVNPAPVVTITPVGPLCQYDPAQNLTVSQGTGTFSGTGVVGNQFDPAISGVGSFLINWTGNVGSCPASAQITIVVNPGIGPGSWPKYITGLNNRSLFNGIITDGIGNVYATGRISQTSNIPSFGTYTQDAIVIVKYNEQCGGIWIRTISNNGGSGYDITLDNNGDVLVTGSFAGTNINFGNSQILTSPSGSLTEVFVLKLDKTTGNTIYARQSTSPIAGSPSSAIGKAIKYDAVNNAIFVTGDFEGTVKFGNLANIPTSGNRDVFVTRYNSSGTEIWSTKIASSFATKPDVAGGIGTDASGNLYVGCSVSGSVIAPVAATNTTAGTTDLFIVKLIPGTGAYGGSNVIRGNGTNDVFLKDLFVDATGRCYITGAYKGALTLGSTLTIAATPDIYVGFATSALSFTGTWSYAYGSTNASSTLESGNSITVYNNDVYFTGLAYSGSTFAGFTPTTVTSIAGGYEVFVARILNGGIPDFLEFSTTTGCAGKNTGMGISVNASSGSIFTAGSLAVFASCGSIYPSVTFNGPPLTALTAYQGFIARSNTSTFFRLGNPDLSENIITPNSITTEQNELNVFPNPTTGLLTLVFKTKPVSPIKISISDISGRIVYSVVSDKDQNGELSLDFSTYENGIYILVTENDQLRSTKRIIVQH